MTVCYNHWWTIMNSQAFNLLDNIPNLYNSWLIWRERQNSKAKIPSVISKQAILRKKNILKISMSSSPKMGKNIKVCQSHRTLLIRFHFHLTMQQHLLLSQSCLMPRQILSLKILIKRNLRSVARKFLSPYLAHHRKCMKSIRRNWFQTWKRFKATSRTNERQKYFILQSSLQKHLIKLFRQGEK